MAAVTMQEFHSQRCCICHPWSSYALDRVPASMSPLATTAYRLCLQKFSDIGVAKAMQGLLQDPDVLHPVDETLGAYPL